MSTVIAVLIIIGLVAALVVAARFLIETGFILLVAWGAAAIAAIVGVGALLHLGWNLL